MAKKRTNKKNRRLRLLYRDSKTGRFASKSTWKRSHAQQGDRYKRERITARKPTKPARLPVPIKPGVAAPPVVFEWLVTFTYDKSGRSFDVIVTARDETESVSVAKEFLRSDPDAQRIARARFHGWTAVPARGNRTDEAAGEAEYRGKSKN